MATKSTRKSAKKTASRRKAPTTQASAYVREEMDDLKGGKGSAKSRKQAIAIGLSRARREGGVKLAPPKKGSAATRKKAAQDLAAGRKRTAKKAAAKKSAAKKASPKKATAKKTAATRKRSASKRTR